MTILPETEIERLKLTSPLVINRKRKMLKIFEMLYENGFFFNTHRSNWCFYSDDPECLICFYEDFNCLYFTMEINTRTNNLVTFIFTFSQEIDSLSESSIFQALEIFTEMRESKIDCFHLERAAISFPIDYKESNFVVSERDGRVPLIYRPEGSKNLIKIVNLIENFDDTNLPNDFIPHSNMFYFDCHNTMSGLVNRTKSDHDRMVEEFNNKITKTVKK